LPADYNHNGSAEQTDYDTWRANYGGNANSALFADGNGNGTVDAGDYVFWRKKLSTPGAGAEAVGTGAPALLAAQGLNDSPVAGNAQATDEAFAGLSDDNDWKSTSRSLPAEKPAATINSVSQVDFEIESTDLLLTLRTQQPFNRSESAQNSASNDPLEQPANAKLATALLAEWPSLD
jgi:hypothetical protein